jgi:hypothetical protein
MGDLPMSASRQKRVFACEQADAAINPVGKPPINLQCALQK